MIGSARALTPINVTHFDQHDDRDHQPDRQIAHETFAQRRDLDVEHHHHEQEQHHHRADVDQDQRDGEELGAGQQPQRRPR